MRHAPALVVTALLVAAPLVQAAAFTFEGDRRLEAGLTPGEPLSFDIAVSVQQEGYLYVKLLPTPRNVINDGTSPKGDPEAGTGWWLDLAMTDPTGARVAFGPRVDSTPTDLVRVEPGDQVVWHVTVHPPADARGDPETFVALAYRLEEVSDSGATSGATINEAYAFTLAMPTGLAALPPAPPTPEASKTIVAPDGTTAPDEESPSSGPTPEVAPLQPPPAAGPGGVVVVSPAVPGWLAALVVVQTGVVLLLVGVLVGSNQRVNAAWREDRALLLGLLAPARRDATEVPIDDAATTTVHHIVTEDELVREAIREIIRRRR